METRDLIPRARCTAGERTCTSEAVLSIASSNPLSHVGYTKRTRVLFRPQRQAGDSNSSISYKEMHGSIVNIAERTRFRILRRQSHSTTAPAYRKAYAVRS